MTTYFCDGIKEVTILNGVARLEFHRLQTTGAPGSGANREVEVVSEMIVALPAQGLLQAMGMLERVRDQLIREGVLKPATTVEPTPPAAPTRSPNFG